MALDFWNPEHVELMKCIGNERSWNIFEDFEALNDEECQVIKAQADSLQQVKEKWIYSKYVNRQFVKFPGNQDLSEDERIEFIRTVMINILGK